MPLIFIAAWIGFVVFAVLYASFSAAIIYHLRAYTLPGWNAGRVSITVFLLFSILLFLLAVYFFFQIPWDRIAA